MLPVSSRSSRFPSASLGENYRKAILNVKGERVREFERERESCEPLLYDKRNTSLLRDTEIQIIMFGSQALHSPLPDCYVFQRQLGLVAILASRNHLYRSITSNHSPLEQDSSKYEVIEILGHAER
jgi:hypothetical protein